MQLGEYPLHPGKCGWKLAQKVASSSVTKAKFPTCAPRGSDGRFKPNTSSTRGKRSGKSTRRIGVVHQVGGDSDEPHTSWPEEQQ